MRRVSILAVACVTLAVPSVASAFQFTFKANGRMSPAHVREVEHAVSFQVNVQVARYYRLSPVSFVATGGIPVALAPRVVLRNVLGGSNDYLGFHMSWGPGRYAIYVWARSFPATADTISHEIIETETDPLATGREICDPVSDPQMDYRLWGVPVSDWVLPDDTPFYTPGQTHLRARR